MDWMDKLLYPLQWVVAWILAIFHEIFTAIGLPAANGWTWVLSIAGLTLVIRAVLIPLFVYQIKSQRKMQLLQPEIQRLQAKYKGKKDQYSRQAMAEEQMNLFRDNKTSPWASCLPLLVQMPIFFSLFRVIHNMPKVADGSVGAIGGFTQDLAIQAEQSSVFGISLSAVFTNPGISVKLLTGILIVIMAGTMFITQKQMMAKNMSESAMANPMMQSQKMLLYVMPLVFGIGGIYFPLGVLFYWLVSNTWTMCQQHVVIRNMPAPGSKAEKEMLERKARKGKPVQKSEVKGGTATEVEQTPNQSRQRQQPVSKNRKKNKKR
ncbi:membrane protein insertase YidC [Brevibacterium aurantiacum]|uniref:Membrane protein insertase YidC n=1 Tax=Brevibacterium aurantiacum TaxID=273384 RepID=A0A2H1HUP7_BREAU|nr:membrane protein insertase YidC [Brevibacterium aurantiacum]TGD38857.1 membrane protein insertase YidC [Brevibacterium aurantiacum]GEB22332.1 membrane protein insertase YidC [Brevibacterium aurantiacum]SMX66586.1 YidC/Oxa1 family membrane protein insertase [Brevibacterium aurantiacum]